MAGADWFGVATPGYPLLSFTAFMPSGIIPEDDQFLV